MDKPKLVVKKSAVEPVLSLMRKRYNEEQMKELEGLAREFGESVEDEKKDTRQA